MSSQIIIPRRGSRLPSARIQLIENTNKFEDIDGQRRWHFNQAGQASGRLFVAEERDLPLPLSVTVDMTAGP